MSDQEVRSEDNPVGATSEIDATVEEQKREIKKVLGSRVVKLPGVEPQVHAVTVDVPKGSNRFQWHSDWSGEATGTRTSTALGRTVTIELEKIDQSEEDRCFELVCKGIGTDVTYRLTADDWEHAVQLAEDFVEQLLEYKINNILRTLSISSNSTPNEVLYGILLSKVPESGLCVPKRTKHKLPADITLVDYGLVDQPKEDE